MAISRFSSSRVTQGLPKYQSAWDVDGVAQGAIEPIASYVMPTTGNISLYNIPQHYQDLMIVASARGTAAATRETLNMDWNYILQYGTTSMVATGSAATGGGIVSNWAVASLMPSTNSPVANAYSTTVWHILNYKNTTFGKTAIFKNAYDVNSNLEGGYQIGIGWRADTGAITFIDFGGASSPFAPGSSFTIYGIKAGA
jgi:hypothetical protein